MTERIATTPITFCPDTYRPSRPRPRDMIWRAGLALAALAAATPLAAQTQVAGVPAQSQAARAEASARIAAQGALTDALKRIAASPTSVQALLDAGRAAITLRDPRAAQGFLGRAAQLDPGNGAIKAALGTALLQTEDAQGALRQFEAARQAGVPERMFLADRALAYDLVGNGAAAQRDYALAQSVAPTPELTRRHALSLGIAGQPDRAVELLAPLLRDQDRAAWRTRAFVLAINGRHAEARDIAYATMPRAMADGVMPYLGNMDRLTPAQQAAAAHFGNFPTGQLGPVRLAGGGTARPAAAPAPARAAPTAANTVLASARTQPSDRNRRTTTKETRQQRDARYSQDSRFRLGDRRGGDGTSTSRSRVRTAEPATPNDRSAREAAVLAARATPAPAPQRAAVPVPSQPAPAATQVVAQLPTPSVAQPGGGYAPLPALIRPAGGDASPLPRLVPGTPPASTADVTSTAVAAPLNPSPVAYSAVASSPVAPVASGVAGRPAQAAANSGLTILAPVVADASTTAAALPVATAAGPAPAPSSIRPVVLTPSAVAATGAVTSGASATGSTTATPAPLASFSLAEIASSIAIPASEMAAPVDALDPVALERLAADARETERRKAADARAKSKADALAAAAVKAKADAAAATKAKADAAAAAEAEAKKAQPARTWVQVATGANAAALASDYRRMARANAEVFKGRSGHTAEWGRTRRLLVGPFDTMRAAQGWLASHKKAGGDGFVWSSAVGEEVTPVVGR